MISSRQLAAIPGVLTITLLLSSAPAFAQGASEAPPAASTAAVAVLQAGIEALGGRDAVLGARRIAFSQEGIGYAAGQARHPGEAITEVERELHYMLDVDRRRLRHESLTLFPGGLRFAALLVLEPEAGFTVDPLHWRQGTDIVRLDRQTLEWNLSAVRRLLPHLVLQQALERETTLRDLGEATHEGVAQRVISYQDAAGAEIVLHFDARAHHLVKVQVNRGALVSEVSFQDYRAVEGLQLPHRTVTHRNGELAEEVRLTRVELNPRLADDLFTVPAGYTDPPAPGEPRVVALGGGLYLLDEMPGAYRSMFVEMDDHVVVLEAPFSPAYTQTALQLIRQTVPEKPIRYVLVTHHHGDHTAGLATFAAEGAAIITGSGTEEAIRAQLERHGFESPERAVIESVAERHTLGSGARRIEIYGVPNTHADGSLIFYLPAERLLFQGDLLYLPDRGPVPPAFEGSEGLARALEAHRLEVERIVGVHGRVGTVDDLREALEKRGP